MIHIERVEPLRYSPVAYRVTLAAAAIIAMYGVAPPPAEIYGKAAPAEDPVALRPEGPKVQAPRNRHERRAAKRR